MVNQHLKDWDLKLVKAKFAYNQALSTIIGHSAFEVVYRINPLKFVELTFLPIDLPVHKDA